MEILAPVAALAPVAIGCGGDGGGTRFERSCRGEYVLECRPHTYTVGTDASFTPDRIRPGDTMSSAHVRFEYEACTSASDGGAATVTEVQVWARYEGSPGDVQLVDLGIVLRDPSASGVMEADVANPFAIDVPGDTDLTLRFVPVRGGCVGDAVELPYRTGARVTP